MNRQGTIDFDILVLIFVSLLLVGCLVNLYINSPEEKACKELGFEDNSRFGDNHVCKDKDGNKYFVDMDCKDYFPKIWNYNCEAKLIKVGEVFGIEK